MVFKRRDVNNTMISSISKRAPRHLSLVHCSGRVSIPRLQQSFRTMCSLQVLSSRNQLLLPDSHLWRNRLARSAVNRKVAGSSPARCGFFFPALGYDPVYYTLTAIYFYSAYIFFFFSNRN